MIQNVTKYIVAGMPENAADYGVYPRSVHYVGEAAVFMVKGTVQDMIIAEEGLGFVGETFCAGEKTWLCCPLNHDNAALLRRHFPFTAPSPVLRYPCSIGVGDRLGIATPGHIKTFEQYNAYPVLAQQSIRELTLTGRTFEQIIDCVTFAVFRENFTRPFGADGDHLKTFEEIQWALDSGCTMITLDCSEHIRNDVAEMSLAEVEAAYVPDEALEARYCGKDFHMGDITVHFDREMLMCCALVYGKAVEFSDQVYHRYFAGREDAAELEISIDETLTPTKPEEHFFVANELALRGVKPVSLAPRFCGEFQKGVDYRGDLAQFEKEMAIHQAVAEQFGYKLSIHSGSDKFSVFPYIAKYCGGRFHLKTAGTNWLEAMALVAQEDPALYREIHQYALDTAFAEAKKYYHVSTDLTKIPSLDTLADDELITLFDLDDARQLIHITYGLILSEKNADGTSRFKDRLYAFWYAHQEQYEQRLIHHIGRHLSTLGVAVV